jgi:hypothetical protein
VEVRHHSFLVIVTFGITQINNGWVSIGLVAIAVLRLLQEKCFVVATRRHHLGRYVRFKKIVIGSVIRVMIRFLHFSPK